MRLCLLIFSLFCFLSVSAQNRFILELKGDSYQQVYRKKTPLFKDSIQILQFLRKLQTEAIRKGYILASTDTLIFSERKVTAILFLGEKIESLDLKINEEDLDLLNNSAKIKEKHLAHLSFNPKEISTILSEIQLFALNNGYPFSSVKIDSLVYDSNTVHANLNFKKGPIYYWSDIKIKGDSSISIKLINSIIHIKSGDLYNESLLSELSNRLKQINYIQELKPFEILFTENGAELFLYLKSVPISSINGVAGLQPNPVTEKISVTGDINLKLINIMHRGETILLNWRSIQPGTQALTANVNYPFLFKSPFGIETGFQLYKRDTTFLETRTTAGIQYLLNNGGYIKAFYQNHSSSLLTNTSSSSEAYSEIRNNAYGMSFNKRKIDYLPNPGKGYSFILECAVGNRLSSLNDTLNKIRSTTIRSSIQVAWYLPVAKRHILKLSAGGETYYAPEIYRNELFRFGGLTSLRGFNEEEIFASTKAIFSVEYRFLTDRNSHAFVFYDQGIYENRSGTYINDVPFGFGTGFSFGTQFGIFSISYALGHQFDNPIMLKNGKIHFGYIAYF